MAVIVGTNGNDILNGTADNPANGTGVPGDDTINGLGGNDVIDGRGGADTIGAGAGDDTVLVTTFGPVVQTERSGYDGGSGIDTLDLSALSQPATVYLSTTTTITNGTNITIDAQNFEKLILGSGSDTVRGTGFNGAPTITEIYLGGGNDDYYGGGGSSMVDRAVFVKVHGGEGDDRIISTVSIYGDDGNDIVSPSRGGILTILEASGAAITRAGQFHASEVNVTAVPFRDDMPIIDGGAGIDTLVVAGGARVDLVAGTLSYVDGIVSEHLVSIEKVVTSGGTIVHGNAGDNVIVSANTMSSGAGDVYSYGGGGNDTLDSGTSGGILDGGVGDDMFYTARPYGSLFETILGGAGNDTVNFTFAFSDATVTIRPGYTEISVNPTAATVAVYHLTGVENFVFSDRTISLNDSDLLVDDLYYLGRNADVAGAGLDPDAHYNRYGWHEGRDPDAFFSTTGYLAANADVRAAALNPLRHYDRYGWHEGRDPSASFDTTLYLLHNPDVAAAGLDPLEHYLQYGQSEGRDIYAAIGKMISANGFDAEYYLLSNPDVAAAAIAGGGDPSAFALRHYDTYGWKEGRDPNAFFDDSGYLAAYSDVAAAHLNPLDHYQQYGWKEGRDPSTAFDTNAYLSHDADVAAAGLNPLTHYLEHGAYEQRQIYTDGASHVI